VRIHCFAFTNNALLHRHPLYSVDSATWLTAEMYGIKLTYGGGRLRQSKVRKRSAAKGKADGFAYMKPVKRLAHNIEALRAFEAYLTHYWQKKGIDWTAQLSKFGVEER